MSTPRPEPSPRDVLDSLALRIAVVDGDGTIRSVNRAWREFAEANSACPSDACEGANYLRICGEARGDGEEAARAFAEGLRAVLDGRRDEFCLEYPCHEPHRRRWFRARITPLREDGPGRAVVTHSDITAHRLIEQSRDESEAILRSVFDMPSLSIGVVELEADDLRFVSVNEATARDLGRSAWELAGRTATELGLPARRIAAWLEHGWGSVRSGEPARFEYVESTPRGPRLMSVAVRPISLPSHERPRLAYVGEDCSDRLSAERENLALDAELRLQFDRIKALRTIDLAINGGLDLPRVLDVVLRQVVAQLGVDAAAVLLRARSRPGMEYRRSLGFRRPPAAGEVDRLEAGPRAGAFLDRLTRAVAVAPGEAGPPAPLLEAEGFRSYWAAPILVRGEVQGILEVGHRSALAPGEGWLAYLETLAGQAAIAIEQAALLDDLRRANHRLASAYEATIEGWSRAMDLRDHETEQHSIRVTEMSVRLGEALGLGREELIQIRRGALLHDIGKVGIPDRILLKAGPLTEEEMAIVRRHPDDAHRILAPIEFLRPALDIPYCHHERWNGRGYPRGLKGDQIPLAARIFAVVDIWDALSSDRPYRAAMPATRVRAELLAMAGEELDPEIVGVFLALLESDGEGTEPGRGGSLD